MLPALAPQRLIVRSIKERAASSTLPGRDNTSNTVATQVGHLKLQICCSNSTAIPFLHVSVQMELAAGVIAYEMHCRRFAAFLEFRGFVT
jgi:hypothetical protein